MNRRKAVSAIAGGAVVAATFMGGMKAAEMRRLSAEKRHKVYVQAVAESKVSVRNTNVWARISQVYKLNPTNAVDVAWIRHVENVSKKTKLPVPTVLLTLEQNAVEKSQIWALQNKIKGLDQQIAGWQVKVKAKGREGRFADSQITTLTAQKSKLGRVISVLSATLEGDKKVVDAQISRMRKTRGSKNAMEKMSK